MGVQLLKLSPDFKKDIVLTLKHRKHACVVSCVARLQTQHAGGLQCHIG